jgi:hypothetical protein
MQSGGLPNFSGVPMNDSQITGSISADNEEPLYWQRILICNHYPDSFSFAFDAHLSGFQETFEYKERQEMHERATQKHVIFRRLRCLSC